MGIINKEQFEELCKSRNQTERNYLAVPGGREWPQETAYFILLNEFNLPYFSIRFEPHFFLV